MNNVLIFTEYARRKIITSEDMANGLKTIGVTYGHLK
jgi:hypothetical protein